MARAFFQKLPAILRQAARQDLVQGAALPCGQLVSCGWICQNQKRSGPAEKIGAFARV